MLKQRKINYNRRHARAISWIGCLSISLLCLGCGGGDDKSANAPDNGVEPIKIGLLSTLTGALGRQGQTYRATIEMAVSEINAAGGVLDRPIELLIADTQTDPAAAVVAAQTLVDQGVVAIVGPVISSSTLEVAANIAIPRQIPIIANASTSPAISHIDDGGMVWRTALSDAFKGNVVARYAFEQGPRSAAILHVDNSFGHGMADEFSAAFTALGGEVIARAYYPELSANDIQGFDYRPFVEEVLADKPDLLYTITFSEDGVKIIIAANTWKTDDYAPLIITEISSSESILSDIGTYEGLVGIEQENIASARQQAFVERYRARYDSDPDQFADTAYDGLYLLALAIEQAGSTAGEAIAAHLQSVSSGGEIVESGAFAAARARIRAGADINYEGASGAIDFDSRGDVSSGTFRVWVIKDGDFVDVEAITVP